MTLTELITAVYGETRREDLVAQTENAVRAATLKAHSSDFYSKDIHETGIEFDTAGYIQSWDYVGLITNWRSLKYFKRVTDSTDTEGKFLDIITPEETLDSYGLARKDVAYVAGRVLEIRSSVEFSQALIGAYVYPVVTAIGYSSWVAEQFPYAIVHEAARRIFLSTGLKSEADGQRELVAEEFRLLKLSALADVGY
jgi:hypothetical protein